MSDYEPPDLPGPYDWIPEVFRDDMRYRDMQGQLWRLDYSTTPGGRWVQVEPKPLELQP